MHYSGSMKIEYLAKNVSFIPRFKASKDYTTVLDYNHLVKKSASPQDHKIHASMVWLYCFFF